MPSWRAATLAAWPLAACLAAILPAPSSAFSPPFPLTPHGLARLGGAGRLAPGLACAATRTAPHGASAPAALLGGRGGVRGGAHALHMAQGGGAAQRPAKKARGDTWRHLIRTATWPQVFGIGGCLGGIVMGSYLVYRIVMFMANIVGLGIKLIAVELCKRYPLPFCFWIVPYWISPTIAFIAVALFVIPSLSFVPTVLNGAQLPIYRVLQADIGGNQAVELRRYQTFALAEVEVKGPDLRDRIKKAFVMLAAYIQGKNKMRGEKGSRGERLDLSGLVMTEQGEEKDVSRIGMVLPRDRTVEDLPVPDNERMVLRQVVGAQYLVLEMQGPLPDDEVIHGKIDELVGVAAKAGIEIEGSPKVCQVLPKVTTEVMFRVRGDDDDAPIDVPAVIPNIFED